MHPLIQKAIDFLHLSQGHEDVLDFMGVVQVDEVNGAGILVMPDQVTAVLRVSGTDYYYGAGDTSKAVVEEFDNVLNQAGLSMQFFVLRRPIHWNLPGGYLSGLADQVSAEAKADPDSWAARRLEKHRAAVSNHEIDNRVPGRTVVDQQFYILIHAPLSGAVSFATPPTVGDGQTERKIFVPPRRGWRLWEQFAGVLSGGDALERWDRQRVSSAQMLVTEVDVLARYAERIPGLRLRRCSALEISQLLHYLGAGDDAFETGNWIPDRATFDAIRTGEADLAGAER